MDFIRFLKIYNLEFLPGIIIASSYTYTALGLNVIKAKPGGAPIAFWVAETPTSIAHLS